MEEDIVYSPRFSTTTTAEVIITTVITPQNEVGLNWN
jgi:hypothetical protein